MTIIAPFQHRKRDVESKPILGSNPAANSDPVLFTKIAKVRKWPKDIMSGKTVSDIASEEGRSIQLIQRHLELSFLSPKLVQQMVEGTQPPELTSRQLLHTAIPTNWDEQHRLFGIS